jgi:hypothetical protein
MLKIKNLTITRAFLYFCISDWRILGASGGGGDKKKLPPGGTEAAAFLKCEVVYLF